MTPHKLPLLAERQVALENCGYCPKLCRATCPVSNAEPRDTITPWGKMSLAWYAARGDVPIDEYYAKPVWACTGCFACRERCDHKNPLVPTLNAARAEFFAAGVAPAEAVAVAERHRSRLTQIRHALEQLSNLPRVAPHSSAGLLVGCSYLRTAPEVAADVVITAGRVLGTSLQLIGGCCGAPLLYAGDRKGFEAARREVIEAASSLETLIVADPGCAVVLRRLRPRTLLQIVDAKRDIVGRLSEQNGKLRWHDPCQLGRGLGVYDAPRRILEQLQGKPAEEFEWRRQQATCSGGGGALPRTMPQNSAAIADARIQQHERLGGGCIVTACGTSLRRFRSRGATVVDLHSLIRRATERK